MSATEPAALQGAPGVIAPVGERTLEILERRRHSSLKRRGPLVRRLLVIADVVGLALAFLVAQILFAATGSGDHIHPVYEYLVFLVSLPAWIAVAKLYRLYDHDDELADHTTIEDLIGVFHLVTVGTWLVIAAGWVTGFADPMMTKVFTFWAAAIALVTLARASVRAVSKGSLAYMQNTVIVGAGDVGQLVARKLLLHGEYGINLVGFVDAEPRERREELGDVPVLGSIEELPDLARNLDIDRVIFAFSRDSHEGTLATIRALRGLDVQVDIVPRLFEIVGPHVKVHTVESLPLVALPTTKRFPFSEQIKRVGDIVGALTGLLLTAPLFAYAAWRIKRESPGPVFFRQQRLGMDMAEFTVLKFRTMRADVDDAPHREYIKKTMSSSAAVGDNGLYKLERDDVVTPFGRWLRGTSLDELPNLINVLRGEMALVGPRPCLDYETELFEPHHFERFLVPAGITGLWQVTARAHSTFGEALDMDVAYARNWSLGLDLWLLCRTPLHILRRRATA